MVGVRGIVRADTGSTALTRAALLVEQATRASGAERSKLADQALAALEADPGVGGSNWLREPLTATPPDLAGAGVRLAAAIDATREPNGPVSANAQAILARVLADSRFHPRTLLDLLPSFLVPLALIVGAVAQVIWSIVRWPFDRLLDLLDMILNSWLFGLFIAVAALGVAAGVFGLYRVGVRSILVSQTEAATPQSAVPQTGAAALDEARRLESFALYREASHFVLIATLLWIEEHRLARFDRSATNREHLAQLAAVGGLTSGSVTGALGPVIHQFDRVWYGQPEVSDADYRELLALAGRVRDALP